MKVNHLIESESNKHIADWSIVSDRCTGILLGSTKRSVYERVAVTKQGLIDKRAKVSASRFLKLRNEKVI